MIYLYTTGAGAIMNYAKQNQRQGGGGYDYGNYDYDYSAANSPQYQNMFQNQNNMYQNQNNNYKNQNTRRFGYNSMNQQQLQYPQQQQRQSVYPSGPSGYASSGYGSPVGGYGSSGYGSSGYGSSGPRAQAKNYGSYSAGYKDCPGIPFALLLITVLGVTVMGVLFYFKVQAAGRKKRSVAAGWSLEDIEIALISGRCCLLPLLGVAFFFLVLPYSSSSLVLPFFSGTHYGRVGGNLGISEDLLARA